MTRTVGSGLQLHYDGSVASETSLWQITRQDGIVLRLTSHDQDVVFGGDTYLAAVGYQRSDLASGATLAVNSVDIEGILNAAAINDTDLSGGRYDYAQVRVSLVNWKDPDGDGETSIAKGFFGEVVLDEVSGSFTTELRGLTQVYAQTIIEQFGRQCRYDVGDSRCTLPILPDVIQNNTAYAVGDVVRVPKVGAANPPITEDYNDTNYRVMTAGTTNASGFVFHSSKGPDADTGTTTLSVTAPSTFTRASGSFIDDSFVADMVFTSSGFTNGANNGTFRVTGAVSALSLTVTAASLVTESGGGDERMVQTNSNNGVVFAADPALRVAGEVLEVIDRSTLIIGPPAGGGLLTAPLSLENAGFETGDLTGWTQLAGTSAITTTFKHSGAYALRLPDNWTGGSPHRIAQTIPLTGYETPIDTGTNMLTVLWWTLTGSLALGDIWVDFTWLDENDATISSTAGTHFDPVGSNTFVQVSQTNTIPALTRSVIVEFNGANGTFEGTIDDITIATTMVDSNFPTDEFKYGVLTFDTGLNAGISKYIKNYDGTSKRFELFESLPFPVTVGDKVGVHIGCNKELSRCIALANVLNHGGYPFIPGDDDFLRYPDSPY